MILWSTVRYKCKDLKADKRSQRKKIPLNTLLRSLIPTRSFYHVGWSFWKLILTHPGQTPACSLKSHSISWACCITACSLPSCPHLPLPDSQLAAGQGWQTAGRETCHHLEHDRLARHSHSHPGRQPPHPPCPFLVFIYSFIPEVTFTSVVFQRNQAHA